MNHRVTVVLNPELGDKLAELWVAQPVWAVSSPANLAAWNRSEQREPNSALFRVSNTEARWDNLKSQLDDIDLHFGLDSHPENPYVGIRVLGLALDGQVEEQLRSSYGFTNFRLIDGGFEADLALWKRLRV